VDLGVDDGPYLLKRLLTAGATDRLNELDIVLMFGEKIIVNT
jgi:hypothetical protein